MSASLNAAKNRTTGRRSNRNFIGRRHSTLKIRSFFERGGARAVALVRLIEYAEATPEVRAVYDDIMRTRGVDWINNFWKALAHDPANLRRVWQDVKQVMAPGALD